jgi:hypothetical protein
MNRPPLNFFDEAIEVFFDQPPAREKTPPCPSWFLWRGNLYSIVELLSEWRDYSRRGRMEKNMTPAHTLTAMGRGSWGVGRFFFRVRVQDERVFDLYYDRAPGNASQRKGGWFLLCERANEPLFF